MGFVFIGLYSTVHSEALWIFERTPCRICLLSSQCISSSKLVNKKPVWKIHFENFCFTYGGREGCWFQISSYIINHQVSAQVRINTFRSSRQFRMFSAAVMQLITHRGFHGVAESVSGACRRRRMWILAASNMNRLCSKLPDCQGCIREGLCSSDWGHRG